MSTLADATYQPGLAYFCPGSTEPVSRAVHLARLASGYPECRLCPHRNDSAAATHAAEHDDAVLPPPPTRSLFTPDGVRGWYLGELTRGVAADLAAAAAAVVWDTVPRPVRPLVDDARRTNRPLVSTPTFTVVVAHDDRSSARDLSVGVVSGLRRMGCNVTQIGPSTVAAFRRGVQQRQAAAGLFVTGAGCGPAWSGIEFAGEEGRPWSLPGTLDAVRRVFESGVVRPRRNPPITRVVHAHPPANSDLDPVVHGLRPLSVVVHASNSLLRQSLQELYSRTACQLTFLPAPIIDESPNSRMDSLNAVQVAVRETEAHVGVWFSERGDRCEFVNDAGDIVPAATVLLHLAEWQLAEHPGRSVLIESNDRGENSQMLFDAVVQLGGKPVRAGNTSEQQFAAMVEHHAVVGGGTSGRYWVHTSSPTEDATLALAGLLQRLSRNDTPMSKLRLFDA